MTTDLGGNTTALTYWTSASSGWDVVTTIDGWRIEAGVVGQPGTLLSEYELVALATDARLRW